ncbi:PoNe immunity protein domain-containing protein [Ectopseudomonas khazarica]|uniref:PoNe immunity protein domain-containing protein n=1 Tax=Ectopseudomonas khazarica TaxID=2502979 RepID=UPI004033DD2C
MRDKIKEKSYFDEYVAFNVGAYADTKARIAAGKVIPGSVTGTYFSVADYCYSALVGRYSRGDEILNLVEPFQIWLDSFTQKTRSLPCAPPSSSQQLR